MGISKKLDEFVGQTPKAANYLIKWRKQDGTEGAEVVEGYSVGDVIAGAFSLNKPPVPRDAVFVQVAYLSPIEG